MVFARLEPRIRKGLMILLPKHEELLEGYESIRDERDKI